MVIIVLTPNGPNVAINIPAGQLHSIRAVESGSVVLAVKDGKYEPLSDADILAIWQLWSILKRCGSFAAICFGQGGNDGLGAYDLRPVYSLPLTV